MSSASEGPAAAPPPAQESGAPAAAAAAAAPRMARRPEVLCGAAVVLGCACLLALRASCSRAKDVTMPAKLPVSFFPSTSPVHDLFLGQLDQAEDIRQSSEISLFFFYAPWCGQSAAVREEIEQVAKSLADQVLFVAINCWWNQGKCRKQKHFFYFPVIYLYHQSFGPIEYKGPMNAVYIEKFVRRVMTPLHYVSSQSKLQQFLSSYERTTGSSGEKGSHAKSGFAHYSITQMMNLDTPADINRPEWRRFLASLLFPVMEAFLSSRADWEKFPLCIQLDHAHN